MEENFDLLAQSRANYFTKGSPVQFVKVELLKGDVTGDIAVCLSFKNISAAPLAQLQITFKCKDRSGAVVCQDQFLYEGLNAAHGEVFGADDAVYISSSPIGSVEVELGTARFADGRTLDLTSYPRVRLAPPKKLPAELAEKLCERTRKEGLTVVPQVLDEGWYCACGAFHPREEDGVWCSECGSDRILLQNTLSSLLQGGSTAPATDDEPTRMVPPVRQEEPTRTVPPVSPRPAPAAPVDEEDEDVIIAPPRRSARPAAQPYAAQQQASRSQYHAREQYAGQYDEPEEDPRDIIAERIIRWAPPITAVLCAAIAAVGFLLTL